MLRQIGWRGHEYFSLTRWVPLAVTAMSLAAVAITAAVGLKLWHQQSHDPVLEELMKIDVLSQMAVGEM